HVDEVVLDPESLGHAVAERSDAEGLRGVVACGDEMDAALPRLGHRRLGGLAGEERVEAEFDGGSEVAGRAPADDADRSDLGRARSISWACAETPLAILETSPLPGTWSPFGP